MRSPSATPKKTDRAWEQCESRARAEPKSTNRADEGCNGSLLRRSHRLDELLAKHPRAHPRLEPVEALLVARGPASFVRGSGGGALVEVGLGGHRRRDDGRSVGHLMVTADAVVT